MLGRKETVIRALLHNYDVDVEPPLSSGVTNISVQMSLNLLCATPLVDTVFIEGSVSYTHLTLPTNREV